MNILKKISLYLTLALLVIVPIFTNAETPTNPTTSSVVDVKIDNPLDCGKANNNDCTLMDLITAILNKIVMPVAAVAVVMWIIWAGFSYVMAQGKPAEIQKAHQRLLWSLIGAGILLGAAGISGVLKTTIEAIIAP